MGNNSHLLVVRRAFWKLIGEGVGTDEAGLRVGIGERTARIWFRDAGGMSPISLEGPKTSRYLTLEERTQIAILLAGGESLRQIACKLGRSASTISREIHRNCGRPNRRSMVGHYWKNRPKRFTGRPRSQGIAAAYMPLAAQKRAETKARRPKPRKLQLNPRLHLEVQTKLTSKKRLSPEQISNRLRLEFPHDESMNISHEAIYQALYVQGRGGLRRELTTCLRTGRALRKPRRRTETRGKRQIPPELMISQRPAEVEDRAIPGHWEGDLILGANNASAIATLVERTTRYVMLLHLPTDHRAETVCAAIRSTITTLPQHLRLSLTWDQGIELTQYPSITFDTDFKIWFCDPHSPWQRGTNENTNGLLRQYFPKGTDLSKHTPQDLIEVAAALNARPRKTLGWWTPAERFHQVLSNPHNQLTVATTP